MSTAAPSRTKPVPQLERFVFYRVGWQGYQRLLEMVGERPARVTYDRGNVELMTPLPIHELYKCLVGRMMDAIGEELDVPMLSQGSTTFHRQDLDRGLEPDQCYYVANAGNLPDRTRIDLDVDPPPDLAIEIDITSSSLDRLGIYAALKIPEVWRFDGEDLQVLLLGTDGEYAPSKTSASFPFLPMNDVAGFLRAYDRNDDSRWGKAFREWLRQNFRPPAVKGEG